MRDDTTNAGRRDAGQPQPSGPRARVAGSPPRPRPQYWRTTTSTSTTATSADHCSPSAQELASGGLRTAAHSVIRVLADDGRRSNYRTASRTDDERDRQGRARFPCFLARVAADARPKIKWVWSSAGDDLRCALQSKRAVLADPWSAETRSSGSRDVHGAIGCEASRGAFKRCDERVGVDKPRLGDLVQRPNDDGIELRSDGRVQCARRRGPI